MSAFGPKQTSASATHMSAFGSKADMTFCAASPLITQSGHGLLHRICLLLTQSGHWRCSPHPFQIASFNLYDNLSSLR